ncbi:MAG: cob(I)yrinic acid a,c-diamide adenosyltransferase [Thermodesulfobacteriota bacterium]
MAVEKGLVHIYTGEGKGKTSASLGLAIRAAGHGMKVLFVQFFKLEGDPSGEKDIIREDIPAIELIRSEVRHPIFTGKDTDIEKVRASVRGLFERASEKMGDDFDLLVLDELMGAVNGGFISVEEVLDLLDARPECLEVVLTGRDAPVELVKRADYVTEMLKIKHPYDGGVKARKGIEY